VTVIETVGAENVGLVTNRINRQWAHILPGIPFWATVDFPRFSRGKKNCTTYFSFSRQLFRLAFGLRKNRFEIAVDLRTQPGYHEGKLVCLLSGAARRIGGPGKRSAKLFLTDIDPTSTGHESTRLRARLERALGSSLPTVKKPIIQNLERAKRNGIRVLIHPGAGHPSKQWPEAHWKSLIHGILSHKPSGQVIIAAAPGDTTLAETISSGTDASVRLTPTIPDLVDLISSASLVIGLDSAAVHISALCGTPALTIFAGTTDPARWHALGNSKFLFHSVPCSPCWSGECKIFGHPCMSEISPKTVLREALALLETVVR